MFFSAFRFTAKLSENYRVLYILQPHMLTISTVSILHHSGTLGTIHEPTLTYHHHSKFIIHTTIHSLNIFFTSYIYYILR